MVIGSSRTVLSHPTEKTRETFRDKMGLELHPEGYIGLRGKKAEREKSHPRLGRQKQVTVGKDALPQSLAYFSPSYGDLKGSFLQSSCGSARLRAEWRIRNVVWIFPNPCTCFSLQLVTITLLLSSVLLFYFILFMGSIWRLKIWFLVL